MAILSVETKKAEDLPEMESVKDSDKLVAYDGEGLKTATAGQISGGAASIIGDEFSEAQTYSEGDMCIYNNTLYKFTADKSAGAWDSSKVEATTVDNELVNVMELQGNLLIQAGGVSITPTANTQTTSTVQFAKPYASAPHVIVGCTGTQAGGTVQGWAASSITTTSFAASVLRTNTTNTTLHWVAIGTPAD